jgi:calcineurin-like phosphoesterase family protein
MGKKSINLHGHSYGRLKPLPRQFDVGVDAQGLRPVKLDNIHRGKPIVGGGEEFREIDRALISKE